MRKIEVHLKKGAAQDAVLRAIKASDPIDYAVFRPTQENRIVYEVFMRDGTSQALVDAIQSVMEKERDWRVNVMAIEATMPQIEERDDDKTENNTRAIREEMLTSVRRDGVFGRYFAIMVVLSSVVAAVGMNSDSAAGVIGAMVIAPLLGPILAFAMGAALGNFDLLRTSGKSLALGIALALGASLVIGLAVPINTDSGELMSRSQVRLDAIALALASGAAAALSLARGTASALVGVMVAAALLPPGAAIGMFAASGYPDLAARAALLLILNVACLVLSALVTFRLHGISPRGWIDQQNATRAFWTNVALTLVFLTIAAALIVYFDLGTRVSLPGTE